ncbi:MAG TPA: PAS domain S-box protein [Bacteroidota bacterium]
MVKFSEYGRVFDLLPEMVFILDEDETVVDHNLSASVGLGYEANKLPVLFKSGIVAGESIPVFEKNIKNIDKSPSFEARFKKADKSVIDVSVDIKTLSSNGKTYSVVISRDITEQKKMELDFLRFSNVIQHTINPIQITDASGKMVYVNPAFETASGYTKEELIGKNPRILNSGKYTRDFWSGVWTHILAGKVWVGRLENVRKDGLPFHTELVISPIVGVDGKVLGFLGAHRDITEQKILEQQLVRSQKMESIGTLAAGLAHEVGNPLTAISSLVQVIERTTNDEFAKEKLGLIDNQVVRITKIIRNLVDFSRPSVNIAGETDVNKVIQDALNIVEYGKRVKNIEFTLDLASHLPKILAVSDQITQVLINLLINAIDSLDGRPGKIALRSYEHDNVVHIEVRDNGKGILEEDREKIFEPFFTTKEIGKGTGLGLWVSYGIIKTFGGEIDVESAVGKGSKFTITFPLSGA